MTEEKEIRLLACSECKTIEELPDFDGPPEYDHLLNNLTSRHREGERPHIGALFKVAAKKWKDSEVRNTVTRQIADKLAGGETGLGHAYYELKDTFSADAMTCWKQHNRNPACNDYNSDKKRLTPDTAAERKAAGLSTYRSANDVYLCQFCPVHQLVVEAYRKRKGLYD